MVADLKESEGKLQAFLPSLDKDFESKVQETKSGKGVVEVTPAFVCASCVPTFQNMYICSHVLAILTMHVAHWHNYAIMVNNHDFIIMKTLFMLLFVMKCWKYLDLRDWCNMRLKEINSKVLDDYFF